MLKSLRRAEPSGDANSHCQQGNGIAARTGQPAGFRRLGVGAPTHGAGAASGRENVYGPGAGGSCGEPGSDILRSYPCSGISVFSL